jgi:hypothetical protein
MTVQYLIGELSIRLEQLQAAAGQGTARDIASLRYQVETGPASRLPAATSRALILADQICWDSLNCGDTASFTRQAAISADLRLFGISARLLEDE